jgi:hypothetical protein
VQHEASSTARLSRALVSLAVLVPACNLLLDTSELDRGEPGGTDVVSSPGDGDASRAEVGASTDGAGSIPPPPSCGTMLPGETLAVNEELPSCNRKVTLIMQSDGNLVLYHRGRAIWATDTFDTDGDHAVMQTDGDFVLYDRHNKRLFSTQTTAWPGAHLEVRDEGSVVVVSDGVVRWTGRW